MNRRIKAWLVIGMLLVSVMGVAGAEQPIAEAKPDEPLLVNPRERYEAYMESTDGSDMLVFNVLDFMNDEETIIAEQGSITVYTDMVDEDGEVMGTLIQGLSIYNSQKVLRISYTDAGMDIYMTQETLFMIQNGELITQPSVTPEDEFLATWGAFYFPYTGIVMLHGIRQTEGGFTYYLIRDGYDDLYEFVSGDNMRIVEARVYIPDDAGDYWLYMRLHYDFGVEPELPEMIKQALDANTPEKPSGINQS